ncbi:MAG: hypothetical protein ACRDWT_05575 [Jatrophihabitantaceae bacterium]
MDGEELLPERPASALLRTPARRRALAGLGAVLLLGALIARVATSGHDRAHPTVLKPPVAEPVQVWHFDASLFPYDPTACPSDLLCHTSRAVPADALMALRARAAGATAVRSQSVQVVRPPGLWFRQLDAAAPHLRIQVVVKRAVPHADSLPAQSSSRSSGFVRINTAEFSVSVRFTGPAGYRPSMAAIRALATDPRLLRLG